jgi:hypothetical protein
MKKPLGLTFRVRRDSGCCSCSCQGRPCLHWTASCSCSSRDHSGGWQRLYRKRIDTTRRGPLLVSSITCWKSQVVRFNINVKQTAHTFLEDRHDSSSSSFTLSTLAVLCWVSSDKVVESDDVTWHQHGGNPSVACHMCPATEIRKKKNTKISGRNSRKNNNIMPTKPRLKPRALAFPKPRPGQKPTQAKVLARPGLAFPNLTALICTSRSR